MFLYLRTIDNQAVKRAFNPKKLYGGYGDLYFGITFWYTIYI